MLKYVSSLQSSVTLHNLTGNVTVWMESYNNDCGCSSDSEVLLIELDTGKAEKNIICIKWFVDFGPRASSHYNFCSYIVLYIIYNILRMLFWLLYIIHTIPSNHLLPDDFFVIANFA